MEQSPPQPARRAPHPLHALFVAIIVVAMPGGNMSAVAQDAPSVVGRWSEREATPARDGMEQIGAIDILPCPGGYCGVRVEAGGACGGVVLKLAVKAEWRGVSNGVHWQNFPGVLDWRGKSAPVHASWRGESFSFTASEPGMHPLSRRSMPVYLGRYVRQGPARCDAPGVS